MDTPFPLINLVDGFDEDEDTHPMSRVDIDMALAEGDLAEVLSPRDPRDTLIPPSYEARQHFGTEPPNAAE